MEIIIVGYVNLYVNLYVIYIVSYVEELENEVFEA